MTSATASHFRSANTLVFEPMSVVPVTINVLSMSVGTLLVVDPPVSRLLPSSVFVPQVARNDPPDISVAPPFTLILPAVSTIFGAVIETVPPVPMSIFPGTMLMNESAHKTLTFVPEPSTKTP